MGTEHPGPPGPGVKRGEAPVLGVLTAVRSPDTLAFPKSYHSVGERELLLFLKLGDGYTGDRCFSDLMYKLHVLSILEEFRIHLSF